MTYFSVNIRRAIIDDLKAVISLIDNEFTKDGFGFVNRAQIETEIRRRRVLVALDGDIIIGVRIGLGTVWNLVVSKEKRGKSIGRTLIEYQRPHTVRVKSDPIGHLSKTQKEGVVDPTGFYEALGFKFWGNSYPKNFWQRGKDGKGQVHSVGDTAHIKIYRDPHAMLME